MVDRSFHKTEAPYSLANDAPEWERLDSMHSGINDYLGNRLSLAQIETPPKRILEIGAGSGAWAIQAAQMYPDAEVLAIDISPLPPRPLPDNVKFQAVDASETLPFEPESFDVVHCRFLLIHLPKFREALSRFIKLVKPGGWILLDEPDFYFQGNTGPAIKKFHEIYYEYLSLRDVERIRGPILEHTLKKSGKFSEVHVQTTLAHFSEGNGNSGPDHLGEVIKTAFFGVRNAFNPKVGLTEKLIEACCQEMEDPERKVYLEFFFVWCRKL